MSWPQYHRLPALRPDAAAAPGGVAQAADVRPDGLLSRVARRAARVRAVQRPDQDRPGSGRRRRAFPSGRQHRAAHAGVRRGDRPFSCSPRSPSGAHPGPRTRVSWPRRRRPAGAEGAAGLADRGHAAPVPGARRPGPASPAPAGGRRPAAPAARGVIPRPARVPLASSGARAAGIHRGRGLHLRGCLAAQGGGRGTLRRHPHRRQTGVSDTESGGVRAPPRRPNLGRPAVPRPSAPSHRASYRRSSVTLNPPATEPWPGPAGSKELRVEQARMAAVRRDGRDLGHPLPAHQGGRRRRLGAGAGRSPGSRSARCCCCPRPSAAATCAR